MRDFWRAIETVHDVVYFAPEGKQRFEALGLKGFWMGYFAMRSAPLGTPSAALVTATFHGFSPTMVARAVPDCWAMADREAVLAERLAIAVDALTPALTGLDVEGLAGRLAAVTDGLDHAGKPLAAGESTLPSPDDAVGRLWRVATELREFRGDVHVAVLVAHGLDGVTANLLQSASGRGVASMQQVRGWSDDAWAAGHDRLVARGALDADGTITVFGRNLREDIETRTDDACLASMSEPAQAAALAVEPDLLAAARAVADSGAIPYPNPVGVPRP